MKETVDSLLKKIDRTEENLLTAKTYMAALQYGALLSILNERLVEKLKKRSICRPA